MQDYAIQCIYFVQLFEGLCMVSRMAVVVLGARFTQWLDFDDAKHNNI